jgi:hypothetical protein
MTDMPDHLICSFASATYSCIGRQLPLDHPNWTEYHSAFSALRSRIETGDAATDRVAELEQECEEYEQQMSAGRALYLKSVEDLAAARAEIVTLKENRDAAMSKAGGVPDGYALVPKVPTKEMMRAFWLAGPYPAKPWAAGYASMLAAAPQPPRSAR